MTKIAGTSTAGVLARGDGRRAWFLGGLITWKETGAGTEGRWALFEQRGRQGFGAPVHIHHRDAEGFYVLEGEVSFHVEDREVSAGPGAFAMVPAGTKHAFVVESDEARMLTILSPAGLVGFFDGLAQPTSADSLPPADLPMTDPEVLRTAAEASGQTILGPPPAPRRAR